MLLVLLAADFGIKRDVFKVLPNNSENIRLALLTFHTTQESGRIITWRGPRDCEDKGNF